MLTCNCGQGSVSDQENIIRDSTSIILDTAIGKVSSAPTEKLPEPKISEEKKKIQKTGETSSPFKSLGCCADESERKLKDCCCKEVLSSYEKMVKSKSKDLNKIKTTGPI